MHGGTIQVSSEVGKGSTFTLIIPEKEPASVSAAGR
jgi:signal transduction histidine kinase